MKKKVSISIDEQTIFDVENKVKEGLFRNKSHLVEYAVNLFLRGGQNGS